MIREEYAFCRTHLRIETSNMLEKISVSTALVYLIPSYMKTASHVIKMVQENPRIDTKPKLR